MGERLREVDRVPLDRARLLGALSGRAPKDDVNMLGDKWGGEGGGGGDGGRGEVEDGRRDDGDDDDDEINPNPVLLQSPAEARNGRATRALSGYETALARTWCEPMGIRMLLGLVFSNRRAADMSHILLGRDLTGGRPRYRLSPPSAIKRVVQVAATRVDQWPLDALSSLDMMCLAAVNDGWADGHLRSMQRLIAGDETFRRAMDSYVGRWHEATGARDADAYMRLARATIGLEEEYRTPPRHRDDDKGAHDDDEDECFGRWLSLLRCEREMYATRDIYRWEASETFATIVTRTGMRATDVAAIASLMLFEEAIVRPSLYGLNEPHNIDHATWNIADTCFLLIMSYACTDMTLVLRYCFGKADGRLDHFAFQHRLRRYRQNFHRAGSCLGSASFDERLISWLFHLLLDFPTIALSDAKFENVPDSSANV